MKFYLGMLVGWWSVCSWSVSEWDYEIDPYYSNIAYYQTLDDSPVPELGERSEAQVYSDLFFSSYLPRFFLLEASLNPMPILGVALKSDDAQNLYEDMTVTQKLNLVAQMIRGKKVDKAITDLTFSKKRIADDVKKCLQSAIANAENNHNLDVDELVVAEAYVGKNLIMKRGRPRARGRFGKIIKPFSELTILVRQVEEQA